MEKTSETDQSLTEVLFEAFEEDHRGLTQGLSKILLAVRAGDLEGAIVQAEDLDKVAGPHIEFEEEVFYPALSNRLGAAFVNQLYEEHDAGKQGLAALLAIDLKVASAEQRKQLQTTVGSDLQVALEHALSCGTLLSQLSALETEELAGMITTLEELRSSGRRWTDRSSKVPVEPSQSGPPASELN